MKTKRLSKNTKIDILLYAAMDWQNGINTGLGPYGRELVNNPNCDRNWDVLNDLFIKVGYNFDTNLYVDEENGESGDTQLDEWASCALSEACFFLGADIE